MLTRERTYNLTQFGINALDRNLPTGVQRDIMEQMFEGGSLTSTDIVTEYSRVDPSMLKRMLDDLVQRNWVQVLSEV